VKVGDVVRLKSGGPKLIVVSLGVDESIATVKWWVSEGHIEQASFPIECLEEVKEK